MAVRHRHAKVIIYRKTERYPFYRIAYRAGGKHIVRHFKTYGAAKREADRIVREIARGNEAAASLSVNEALAYKFARAKLDDVQAELNSRRADLSAPDLLLSLEDAILEYVEAKRAFGPRRLIEAVQGFLSTIAQVKRVPIRQVVDEFLADRDQLTKPASEGKRPQLSPKLAYQHRLRLKNRFADKFKGDVCDLTKDHLDLFFGSHLKALSPRPRNHYRGTLRNWLRYCVAKDYLLNNHRLNESTGLCPNGRTKESEDSEDISLYGPEEFSALLAHADPSIKPMLAIGGLAGLRAQELLRLEWDDVWRRPGYIEITRGKAKTRSRRLVPIQPALAAWLEPHRERTTGRVWFQREWSFHDYLRLAAAAAGIQRRGNALRHSFITYRLAVTHDEGLVAGEAGTSPQMIHKHYRELVTTEAAKAWFEVTPTVAAGHAAST